jgi:hypothetical protein
MSSRPVVHLVWETGHRIVRLSGDAFQGIEIDGLDEHGRPATVILASDVFQRISLALTTQADALGLTGRFRLGGVPSRAAAAPGPEQERGSFQAGLPHWDE